jgi:hypothetical protein
MWNYFDRRARRLGIFDTKLAQGASIFFALTIVKLIPEILEINIWWFVALTILCAVKPSISFFGPERTQQR